MCHRISLLLLAISMLAGCEATEPPEAVDLLVPGLPVEKLQRPTFNSDDAGSDWSISPDGRCVAVEGEGRVRVWSIGGHAPRMELPGACRGGSLYFTPDNRSVLFGPVEGPVVLWDWAANRQVREFRNPNANPSPPVSRYPDAGDRGFELAALSADGATLAAGTGNFAPGIVRIWNVSDGTLRRTMVVGEFWLLAISPDGSLVAASVYMPNLGSPTPIGIWDTKSGRCLEHLELPCDIHALAMPSNDLVLAAGGYRVEREHWTGLGYDHLYDKDCICRVWKRKTSARADALPTPPTTSPAASSARARRGAFEIACDLQGYDSAFQAVAATPDGRLALTSDGSRTARLWDLSTGREIKRFTSSHDFGRVGFLSDGRAYAAVGWWEQRLKVWIISAESLNHHPYPSPPNVPVSAPAP